MGIIIFGSLIFVYGLALIVTNSVLYGWITATVGLTLALRGVCEVTAELVARKLADSSTQASVNTASHR